MLRLSLRSFVMNRSCRIYIMSPPRHSCMVRTCSRFISQRPEDDARIVLVTNHHPGHTLHECSGPCVVVGEHSATIMSFKIRLIHHIDTILVAQFIYIWIIRIMTGTDRVEIELLHQADISLHFLSGNRLTAEFAMIVTIDTIELHRHTIDQKLLILYLDVAESYLAAASLYTLAFRVQQAQHQSIQIWCLRSPLCRI